MTKQDEYFNTIYFYMTIIYFLIWILYEILNHMNFTEYQIGVSLITAQLVGYKLLILFVKKKYKIIKKK